MRHPGILSDYLKYIDARVWLVYSGVCASTCTCIGILFLSFIRGVFFEFCFFGGVAGCVSRTNRKKRVPGIA